MGEFFMEVDMAQMLWQAAAQWDVLLNREAYVTHCRLFVIDQVSNVYLQMPLKKWNPLAHWDPDWVEEEDVKKGNGIIELGNEIHLNNNWARHKLNSKPLAWIHSNMWPSKARFTFTPPHRKP